MISTLPLRLPTEPAADRGLHADLWVVVPALNEAPVIGRIVRELRVTCPFVIVVDDGSSDGTGQEALAAGAVVARHALNLGQGAALQTGVEYALSRGAAYVATFDADGQHHAEDLLRMVGVLREQEVDVVLGSRFLGHTENMPFRRRLVLKAAVVLTRLTTGVKLTDAHNGMRVMTAAAARQLHIVQDQMAHASEFVAQAGRLGLRIAEVPVTISYTRYSLEKGQRLSNSVRILMDLVVGWLLR
jgi:glycosyltransferase involved in cell wall biosynthesis